MRLPRLDYPITKDFPPCFSLIIGIAGFVWISFITVVIVVAVGYEYDLEYSTTFNSTETLWYERHLKWIPWIPATQVCSAAELWVTQSIIQPLPR
jgi:hypothetical protein